MIAMAKGFQDSAVQSRCLSDASDDASGDVKPSASSVTSLPGAAADEADLLIREVPEDRDLLFCSGAGAGLSERGGQLLSEGSEVLQPCSGSTAALFSSDSNCVYPMFHETNPFRLSASSCQTAGRESLLARTDGGSSQQVVVRRRISQSSLTEIEGRRPPTADSERSSLRLSQSSLPEPESHTGWQRRDSFWDRLPGSAGALVTDDVAELGTAAGASSYSRHLISVSPFSSSHPTADQTRHEGRELFLGFVRDRIEQDLPEDELPLVVQQNDEYIGRILAMPGLNNPVWAQTGAELRCMADAFASSHQRQELRSKAELTNLTDITWERFRKLLEELFAGEAGVTQERILVLFFFLADCVIATLRRHAWRHIRRLIEWSLRYIVERVCALVQEAGGWTVVFRSSIEYVIMLSKISAFVLLGLAAFVYIRKNI